MKKIKVFLKILIWLITVFLGYIYIGFKFIYWSISIFPLFLLILFSIFLWLIIFKRKIKWLVGIFIIFIIFFYIYFKFPSNDCGGSYNFKLPPYSECKCLGFKKIGEHSSFDINLRCIGKVTGWENEVK